MTFATTTVTTAAAPPHCSSATIKPTIFFFSSPPLHPPHLLVLPANTNPQAPSPSFFFLKTGCNHQAVTINLFVILQGPSHRHPWQSKHSHAPCSPSSPYHPHLHKVINGYAKPQQQPPRSTAPSPTRNTINVFCSTIINFQHLRPHHEQDHHHFHANHEQQHPHAFTISYSHHQLLQPHANRQPWSSRKKGGRKGKRKREGEEENAWRGRGIVVVFNMEEEKEGVREREGNQASSLEL